MDIIGYLNRRVTRAMAWRAIMVVAAGMLAVVGYLVEVML